MVKVGDNWGNPDISRTVCPISFIFGPMVDIIEPNNWAKRCHHGVGDNMGKWAIIGKTDNFARLSSQKPDRGHQGSSA